MMGRIKPDVTRAQAQSDLETIAQRLVRDYPRENAAIHIGVSDFRKC